MKCISRLLNKELGKLGITKRIEETRALFAWHEVVGEKINEHTRPLKITSGKMYVAVDSSIWLQELTFIKQDIIDRINLRLGKVILKDISLWFQT